MEQMFETEIEQKKLSPIDAIVIMTDAINKGKLDDFYKTVHEYTKNYKRGSPAAWRILSTLQQKPAKFLSLNELSNDLKSLIIQGQAQIENVYVNSNTRDLIDTLLLEWANTETYTYHNLKVRNKILLHGPTGNGKTTIARYIAQQAKIPFVEIKSEEIIDSKLGNSGYNIHKILNGIKEPCVLFWDEVDSIGCKRGNDTSSSAGHENDRMTNSILVNLDKILPEVIFIGATNRRHSLDSAFLRRFDVQYEIPAPTVDEKLEFARQLISYHKLEIEVPDLSNYASYSDIKTCIVSIARNIILAQLTQPAW